MRNDDVLEVKIKKREVHFIVWLVPLVALIIGGWMVYKYYSKLGPLVQITFKNSGGLEPKQSIVKFRDVKVGTVERIEILRKTEGVSVYVRMDRDVEPFLNEHARFWIVKPEIGLGRVRGLDALMSGAYIQMDSKLGGESKYRFTGLEEPPLEIGDEEGRSFVLRAPTSYALSAGLPVFYKDIQVGTIKKIDLAKNGGEVLLYIFVKKPYDALVNRSTRFWNVKAVDVGIEDGRLQVRGGSLAQLLLGGISFATLRHDDGNTTLADRFYLYSSFEEAMQKRLGKEPPKYERFVMEFRDLDGNLRVGDSVRYRGYKIGEVAAIEANVSAKDRTIPARVIARIDINAFASTQDGLHTLQTLARKGLAARIESANMLTNSQYIALDFGAKGYELHKTPYGYRLATLTTKGEAMMDHINKILQKLENLPLEKALDSFTATLDKSRKPLVQLLQELHATSKSLRMLLEQNATKAMPNQIEKSLIELQAMMKSFKQLADGYGDKSLFSEQLKATLKDIDQASKALNKVLIKIYKKPNTIIFGD